MLANLGLGTLLVSITVLVHSAWPDPSVTFDVEDNPLVPLAPA